MKKSELEEALKELQYRYPCEDWSNIEERVHAPIISQVLKWLREKQFIIIPVPHSFDANGNCASWHCDIWAGG